MYSIEKFCGCCKINVVTWSKVVAFQGLMWGPIYLFFGILYFTPKESIFAKAFLEYSMQKEFSESIYDFFKVDFGLADQAGIIILFFMIITPLLWMITDILMLHGIWHNKPGFLKPWVVLHMIFLVFFTIHSLASLVIIWYCYLQDFGYHSQCPRPDLGRCDYCKQAEEYTIHGIFCIVSNLLGYYFWRVVWSAYKEIKAENVNFVKLVPYPKSERTKPIGQDIKMITYRTSPNPDHNAGGSNLNLDEEAVNRSTETGISIIFNAFDPPKTTLPIKQV